MSLLKKICLIISILLTQISYSQDTVYLNLGEKAPFSGYLIPPDTAKKQRQIGLERDSLKLTNQSLQNSLTYQSNIISDDNSRIKELTSDKKDLADQLGKQSSANTLEHIGYFALGVLATSLAVMAAKQLTK